MEEEYWTECYACEMETQVVVFNEDELPCFCPMCGSPVEFEMVEED